jgi:EmrB/QacA subfamily drug resistance transporter
MTATPPTVEAPPLDAGPGEGARPIARSWVLLVACVSAATVVASVTSLNVTVSSLIQELGFTFTQVQWVIAAYPVALAGLLLPAGSIADRVGSRRVLVAGLVGFAIASLLAMVSSSPLALTGFRALAGAAAAFVIPTTLVVTINAFPPRERGKAIGVWAAAAGVGAAAGVLIAGGLLEFWSWRSIFAFMAIAALIDVVGVLIATPRDVAPTDPKPIDVQGAVFAFIALTSAISALILGADRGFTSLTTLSIAAVAVMSGLCFWDTEQRKQHPLLDLSIVRQPGFVLAVTSVSVQFLAMYGMQYLTLQYFQLVQGGSPLEAGLRNLPFPIALMLVSPRAHRLVERFGIYRVAPAGLILLLAGSLTLAQVGTTTNYLVVATGLALFGLGLGVAVAPATAAILTALPFGKAGVGAALNDVSREIGGALGIAVMGGIAASFYRKGVGQTLQSLPEGAQDAAAESLGAAVGISKSVGETGSFIALNARQSFMDGYDAAFRLSAVLLLATLALVVYLVNRLPNRGRPAPSAGPPDRSMAAAPPVVETLIAESPIGAARAGVSPTVMPAAGRTQSRGAAAQRVSALRTSVDGETRFLWVPDEVAGTHRERREQRRAEHEPVRSKRSQRTPDSAKPVTTSGIGVDREFVESALPGYELGEVLGQGSWGVVATATHKRLDRVVAIKVLPPAFAADTEVRGRFAAEAKLLASFDDPHIVPIFDFVDEPEGCLLVMEYMPGGNVWTRFTTVGLAFEASVAIALTTALALHYSHSRGVLHRDIKPDNLLFSNTGAVKVTDFGLAKVLGGSATMMTRAGQVLGTPAYIAPEQALGETLTPVTDVYSVGAMLFELLSGDLPFPDDGSPITQLMSHISDEPRELHAFAPDVPEPLAAPVMRAISRDPAARQGSAWDFASELSSVARELWGVNWLDHGAIPIDIPERLTSGQAPEDTSGQPAGPPPGGPPPGRPEPERSEPEPVVGQTSEPRRSKRMASPTIQIRINPETGEVDLPSAVESPTELTMDDIVPVDSAIDISPVDSAAGGAHPPAWHPDPWHVAAWRWWDGESWTHHTG